MFSTELSVIIPIILILILTVFMMFHFAVELDVFQLYHGRAFLMSVTEPSNFNGYVVKPSLNTITKFQLLRNLNEYEAKKVVFNPFSFLNGRVFYNFETEFRVSKINRIWVSFVKDRYSIFLE